MARILLVDDDETLRPMLRIVLERLGHDVAIATNGVGAIARYAEQPPDVVLTDIIMPDKEGLETIRELKHRDPGVRIIAMSGGGRGNADSYLYVALKLGASRVLTKPFSLEELVEALDAVLRPPVTQ